MGEERKICGRWRKSKERRKIENREKKEEKRGERKKVMREMKKEKKRRKIEKRE